MTRKLFPVVFALLLLVTAVYADDWPSGPICDPHATRQALEIKVDLITGEPLSRSVTCLYPIPLAVDCWDWPGCKSKVSAMCRNMGCEGAKSYSLEQTVDEAGNPTDVCSGPCDGCPVQTAVAAYCTEAKPEKPAPVTGVPHIMLPCYLQTRTLSECADCVDAGGGIYDRNTEAELCIEHIAPLPWSESAAVPCPEWPEQCETKLSGACANHGGVETGSGRLALAGGVARCTAVCNDGTVVGVNTHGCWDE